MVLFYNIGPGEYSRGKYHCTIDLLFDWFGLVCFANKKIVSCHRADSKPVKQEVNGTLILPPLVFLEDTHTHTLACYSMVLKSFIFETFLL
jgi:hypothetical protein